MIRGRASARMRALEVLGRHAQALAELKLRLSLDASDLDSTDLMHAASCLAGAAALVESARRRLTALPPQDRGGKK